MSATTDEPLPLGYQLDQYRILSVLGRGGFGYTYLAQDNRRATQVAIKEHFPQQLAQRLPDNRLIPLVERNVLFEQTLDNFRQEIRLLLRFPHPNLPYIHRVFDGLGTGYFSMDLEQGETLEKWTRAIAKDLLEDHLLSIVYPISDALALLHRNGIFHLDIKPDNIIVRRDGSPVLLDFGIATDSMAAGAQILAGPAKFVSVGYSPHEQYGRGPTGAWSDIYSLSATLYKIIAKRRAVAADVRAKAVLNGRPDPLPKLAMHLPAGISATLASAIDRGLELDPKKRPHHMAGWLDQLPPMPQKAARASKQSDVMPGSSLFETLKHTNADMQTHRQAFSRTSKIWFIIGSGLIIFLTLMSMAILTL